MDLTTLKNKLGEIQLNGADWISFRYAKETVERYAVRDKKPESNDINDSRGVMIEVMAGGAIAYAASPSLDKASLQAAADQALEVAKKSSSFPVHAFTASDRPSEKGSHSMKFQSRPTAKNIFAELSKTCDELKRKNTVLTSCYLELVNRETFYVSTAGAEWHQDIDSINYDASSVTQDGPVVQSRSLNGRFSNCFQGQAEALFDNDYWERVKQAGDECQELLSAEECPTETTNLVLLPNQLSLQIHESIGHPLEIDRILGDERNYAGASFVKPEDFGTLQYGSEKLNVTFDPDLQNQMAGYQYDDTGLKAEKQFLIKDGKLIRGLGGVDSQLRSGLPGVANQRASMWNRPPIDRICNVNVEPGTSTYDEIIGSVERGVLMDSYKSWSIDDYRRKFQFGCEYAKLIENGKITKTLRNPNYRAITLPFWRSLKMTGNQDTFGVLGSPYCGKGEPNQVIWVGHASPVCLFENIEVFGGDS